MTGLCRYTMTDIRGSDKRTHKDGHINIALLVGTPGRSPGGGRKWLPERNAPFTTNT
jgi:hypothetical protein